MAEDRIRAIARALAILRAMNERETWSLHGLHLRVGLPKSTLFRILQTLQAEGYVRAEERTGSYCLTAKVRDLGNGYTERSRLVDLGAPIALAVTRSIKWPLAIGTLDGDALVVRYSTMPYSPLAVHATTLGQRLGLAETAMGKVYLAHCAPHERAVLLQMLRREPLGAVLYDEDGLCGELALIARQGYAVRLPSTERGSATIAVAIRQGEEVGGALGLTTFGRMMTGQLIATYLPILQRTAEDIAAALAVPPDGIGTRAD